MSNTRKARVSLTQLDIIAVGALLFERCQKLPDGKCRYVDGWSDEEVAKQANLKTGGRVTKDHVGTARRLQGYGNLWFPKPEKPLSADQRIHVLEGKLRYVCGILKGMCDNLGVAYTDPFTAETMVDEILKDWKA